MCKEMDLLGDGEGAEKRFSHYIPTSPDFTAAARVQPMEGHHFSTLHMNQLGKLF